MTKQASTSALTEKQVASILTGLMGTLLRVSDEKTVFSAFEWLVANKDDVKKVLSMTVIGLDQSGLADRLKSEFQKQ